MDIINREEVLLGVSKAMLSGFLASEKENHVTDYIMGLLEPEEEDQNNPRHILIATDKEGPRGDFVLWGAIKTYDAVKRDIKELSSPHYENPKIARIVYLEDD